eukprot:m51a1_g3345 putative serine threonine-protein kinase 4 (592) ;mRNA; f:402799-404980
MALTGGCSSGGCSPLKPLVGTPPGAGVPAGPGAPQGDPPGGPPPTVVGNIAASDLRAALSAPGAKASRYHDLNDGQYSVLQRIGKGSFGTVYKAVDTATGDTVALKRVETEDVEGIAGEIAIMEQLHSPFLVAFFGTFLDDDYLWITMEFCPYGSVSDVMTLLGRPLTEAEIAGIAADMLQGLIYLHSQRKVHRDIKPQNVLISQDGSAKIGDFGISGQLGSFMERRNTVVGTPYYIAPEVLHTGSGYCESADLWSLGISVIEMAQMYPPYHKLQPLKVLLAIPANPPPTLAEPARYSKEFSAFIAYILVKDPSKRPSHFRILNHPWMLSHEKDRAGAVKRLMGEAKAVIDNYGTLEDALHARRVERGRAANDKQQRLKSSASPDIRQHGTEDSPSGDSEEDVFRKQADKERRRKKISGKLKRFFQRRPSKEHIEHILESNAAPAAPAAPAVPAAPAPVDLSDHCLSAPQSRSIEVPSAQLAGNSPPSPQCQWKRAVCGQALSRSPSASDASRAGRQRFSVSVGNAESDMLVFARQQAFAQHDGSPSQAPDFLRLIATPPRTQLSPPKDPTAIALPSTVIGSAHTGWAPTS